ncbi:MAG: hypothetical protein WCG26_07330 [Chloroflexales bacterium]
MAPKKATPPVEQTVIAGRQPLTRDQMSEAGKKRYDEIMRGVKQEQKQKKKQP